MIARKITWRALALGSTAVLVTALTPSAAHADTRTIQGSYRCTSGYYIGYAEQTATNTDPTYVNVSPSPVADPGTQKMYFTVTISSTASQVYLRAKCGGFISENYYFSNWPANITPGTSTLNVYWTCSRFQVYPGPYVHSCNAQSVS